MDGPPTPCSCAESVRSAVPCSALPLRSGGGTGGTGGDASGTGPPAAAAGGTRMWGSDAASVSLRGVLTCPPGVPGSLDSPYWISEPRLPELDSRRWRRRCNPRFFLRLRAGLLLAAPVAGGRVDVAAHWYACHVACCCIHAWYWRMYAACCSGVTCGGGPRAEFGAAGYERGSRAD